MKGQALIPAITDNHVMHILEHTANIDTVEARLNPNEPYVVQTLNHIMAHINMLTTINPVLAGIIGDPTLPPGTPSQLQLKPAPPPQPGQQPPQGPPQQAPNPGAGPAGRPAPAVQQNRQPGGPTNPAQPQPNQGMPMTQAPQQQRPPMVPQGAPR